MLATCGRHLSPRSGGRLVATVLARRCSTDRFRRSCHLKKSPTRKRLSTCSTALVRAPPLTPQHPTRNNSLRGGWRRAASTTTDDDHRQETDVRGNHALSLSSMFRSAVTHPTNDNRMDEEWEQRQRRQASRQKKCRLILARLVQKVLEMEQQEEQKGDAETKKCLQQYRMPAQHMQQKSRRSRYFATKAGPSTPGGQSSSGDSNRTERDFAEYLSGASATESIDSPTTTSSSSASQLPPPASPPTPPRDEWQNLHHHTSPTHGPSGPDLTETYLQIQRNQRQNVEKSRARTAANVRRALSGNLIICVAKLGAWMSSGSSSMLSEFIHSIVDCGNQSLLLLGLRDSAMRADRSHPYGYGKSVYFWALVSALGTFFMGAGVSMTHSLEALWVPRLDEITWHVWSVLGLSLAVDGYVLAKTVQQIREQKPRGVKFLDHFWTIRDPATLAVLLEDGAACLGVLIAISGIAATSVTGAPVFDGLAGVGISALLGTMGVVLVRVNHRFLLGHAVDRETMAGIEKILLNRRSIEDVHSVQSQWIGPDTFSYKAEVDFDGTFLAAKLMPRYQKEFHALREPYDQDLRVLLSWYAEDVMRTVEGEVRHIEAEIRKVYPGAEYIELEPMSKDTERFMIDDGMEAQLKRIEIEALNRYLKSLYKPNTESASSKGGETGGEDKVAGPGKESQDGGQKQSLSGPDGAARRKK